MIRILLLMLISGLAQAGDWSSTEQSSFTFEAGFEGEPLPGEFKGFTVSYSTESPSLIVSVDLTKADMGDEDMNAILSDAAWFATDTHTTAQYRADNIEKTGPASYLAKGELSLKGFKRPVDVPFEWTENGDTAIMRGELTINRTNFEVGTGEWSTGDSISLEVKLRFDVTLVPAK